MLRSSLLVLVLGALAAPARAQTTHVVQLVGTSFSPSDLTVAVGDTVRWDWVSGIHNVESGAGGVHDGIFRSGDPVSPPQSFSVTFDAALLAASPVPGKVYAYYCAVHVGLGMTGSVTVEVPSSLASRNAGSNPASLSTVGAARIGTTLAVLVDLGTSGHASALLFGFDSPFQLTLAGGQTLLCLDLLGSGELLGLAPQAGPTAFFPLAIPDQPSLCGFSFCMQAIHFGGGVVPFALSDALDVTVGNS